MLSAGRQRDTARKAIFTCRITIDNMIFKEQNRNEKTQILLRVKIWVAKHTLQQMQGLHEKPFSI